MTTRYITALVLALILTTMTANAQRDSRQWHDEYIVTASGGYEKNSEGETGYRAELSYDHRMFKSNAFLGMMVHGSALKADDLHDHIYVVGMDVALSYRFQLGAVYIQPRVYGGLGMVSHNTVMESEPDMFGDYNRIERQQSYFAPEVGGRIDVGVQMGKFGIGAYASYTKQFGQYAPTTVNENLTVTSEWLTQTPFSAGIAMRWDVDHGVRHRGGNNVPLIGAHATYGNNGLEAFVSIIFQRNTGLFWLWKEDEGLRGEYIASTHYGLRFGVTDPAGLCRTSAQVGYGLFFHPGGPESVLCWRVMGWLGVGESATAATTQSGEAVGRFGTVQATPKGNLEADFILHFGRFDFMVKGGVGYQVTPGTQTSGASVLVDSSSDAPFSYYGGIGGQFAF